MFSDRLYDFSVHCSNALYSIVFYSTYDSIMMVRSAVSTVAKLDHEKK